MKTIVVDGKKLALEIQKKLKEEVRGLDKKVRLAVVFIGGDPASESYIKRKKSVGEKIGIEVDIKKPSEEIWKSRTKLRSFISKIVHDKKNTGVIVQLPLPDDISSKAQYILDAVIPQKDVDVLSASAFGKFVFGQLPIEPTLIGSVKEIVKHYKVDLKGKKIVLVGAGGRLVGRPIALWLLQQGLSFSAITRSKSDKDFKDIISHADIIFSGVGKAGLISVDMVKDGVMVFDAGTSGEKGQLKGDFDPDVAKKASLFTPVPGSIGPLTVVMLFKNLVELAKKN